MENLTEQISLKEFEEIVANTEGVIFYFYSETCGVCTALFPKLKNLVRTAFPQLKLIRLSAEVNRHLAYQLRMTSVPGIIGFLAGKEFFRSNGLISLGEFHHRISRPYGFFFES